jgi:KUP system potassium uptake protein
MSHTQEVSLPSGADQAGPKGRELSRLCLLALGVVYGDIGTSPLYALRECFHGAHAATIDRPSVLGVLSLIFWAIVIVVTVKYLLYVLRANNRGEGGILAMVALVHKAMAGRWGWKVLLPMGLFGGALLYGDGMLTPAISVISAVEGLKLATPALSAYVVPITIVILIMLFAVQRRGTGGVGIVFGPVMIVWFATLALVGTVSIVQNPGVLWAISPYHAAHFLWTNGETGFFILGAVFLVTTGAEALYADLGHFGRKPIQIDWFALVAPALLLNYFGQGALLLRDPEAAVNPFYNLLPEWGQLPMVGLATLATIIASQALISGVFSLTAQAVQLGYFPRVRIVHTSSTEFGQIYVPGMNWMMMIGTIALVIGFGSSSAMASAYGVAIATTMVITTVLAFSVSRHMWKWKLPIALAVTISFLAIDMVFFTANIVKIGDGGWFPLLLGMVVYLLMTTWERGRRILATRIKSRLISMTTFIESLRKHPPTRVRGTAVFLTGNPDGVPLALVHHLKHSKTLHERVISLSVRNEDAPRIANEERVEYRELGEGFHQVIARYGFMEEPNIPQLLRSMTQMTVNIPETSFFMGRETLLLGRSRDMLGWRKRLFIMLSRNAQPVNAYFHIPPDRVVELGAQIEL